MSTTIHMHIEVKKDGKWLHYATTSASHDRLFFDLVAGIYGVFPCVVSPRVCPKISLRSLPSATRWTSRTTMVYIVRAG